MVGILCVGAIISAWGPRLPYLIVLPLVLLVLLPTLGNYLREAPLSAEDRASKKKLWQDHPELLILTAITTTGMLVLNAAVAYFQSSIGLLFGLAVGISAVVLCSFLYFMRPEIAKPILFDFLLALSYVNLEGGYFYFYTNDEEKYVDGPNFTPFFYTAGLGLAAFAGVFVGYSTGEIYFKHYTYQQIVKFTLILRVFTALGIVPIVMRWTDIHSHDAGNTVSDTQWKSGANGGVVNTEFLTAESNSRDLLNHENFGISPHDASLLELANESENLFGMNRRNGPWYTDVEKIYIMVVLFFDGMVVAWRWIPKQVLAAHLTPDGVLICQHNMISCQFSELVVVDIEYLAAKIFPRAMC